MPDAYVVDPATPVHLTKHGRAELLKVAESRFDAVITDLQAMRAHFVAAGDHESLGALASNLEGETW